MRDRAGIECREMRCAGYDWSEAAGVSFDIIFIAETFNEEYCRVSRGHYICL